MADTLRLLSRKQVRELVTLSYTDIDRKEAAGQFPKRVRLSAHPRGRCAYVYDEIQAWLRARIGERDRKSP